MQLELRYRSDIDLSQPSMQVEIRSHILRCLRHSPQSAEGVIILAGDRDKLRAAMEAVNIQSPLGPFQFTASHDVKQTVWIIAMDGAGGFTLVHEIGAS